MRQEGGVTWMHLLCVLLSVPCVALRVLPSTRSSSTSQGYHFSPLNIISTPHTLILSKHILYTSSHLHALNSSTLFAEHYMIESNANTARGGGAVMSYHPYLVYIISAVHVC